MTKYEIISIVISIIALAAQFFQWIWKKWILTAKVNYYPTGQITLFFNQSGSYLRINGVLESERSATTIKNMKITITRKHDNRKMNLVWSYLISPVSQSMLGRFIQTTEAAHPFRVEADSTACAFVEYSDPDNSSWKKIQRMLADLARVIQQITSDYNYDEALNYLSKSDEYRDAKSQITNDFFWEIGKYTVDIIVDYGKNKTKSFSYEFNVSEQNYFELKDNIDEILLTQLKNKYQIGFSFKSPMVEISKIN